MAIQDYEQYTQKLDSVQALPYITRMDVIL